jgi:hypothetical protein
VGSADHLLTPVSNGPAKYYTLQMISGHEWSIFRIFTFSSGICIHGVLKLPKSCAVI